MKQIAPESKAFLVSLFTDLRKDLADRTGAEGHGGPDLEKATRDLAIFDALLRGLAQPQAFPDDERLREYVADLAKATDEENEYERASLEHRALEELGAALANRKA